LAPGTAEQCSFTIRNLPSACLRNTSVQRIANAKKAGRKYALIRVEREGNYRFVTLPVEAG